MSAFKRYQSKVFWNQMQELDIGAKSLPLVEESLDSSKDTTGDANITVIRRDRTADNSKEELSQSPREESNEEKEAENRLSARPCSPASQGHRSQDSGFSDSDRSECSDNDARSRPRRSRRRGRIRRHLTIDSLCNPPAYTSTPKQDPASMEQANSLARQHVDISKTRWDLSHLDGTDKCDPEISIIQSRCDESITDFLFTEEPPEDSNPSSSSCSGSGSSRTSLSLADRTLQSSRSTSGTQESNRLAPVKSWLYDLAYNVENESDTVLEEKAFPNLISIKNNPGSINFKSLTSSSTAAATKLLVKADKFDQRFESINKRLSEPENSRVERELIQSIEEEAYKILTQLGAPPPRRIHQGSLQNIKQQLNYMKADIEKAVEARLDLYIERVVRSLEESLNEERSAVRGPIAALTALGLAGTRAARSIARCDGVRGLLAFLLSTWSFPSELRCAALRALACVCSCSEAIESFAREEGPEVLADILASSNYTESEKTEAAALIVQLCAPWTNAQGATHLAVFADSLVRDLTELAEKTSCSQTLLLCAAALNYSLTAESKFVQPVLENDSVRVLLGCVKRSAGGNVCLMEQVAALIGELAKHPCTFPHLAKARASVALISFLRMRPSDLEDTYKRLEITASAALTRMCVDPEIARQVVALGGTDCLPSYDISSKNERGGGEPKIAFERRFTKSLRLACREAAEQIDVAKSADCFTL